MQANYKSQWLLVNTRTFAISILNQDLKLFSHMILKSNWGLKVKKVLKQVKYGNKLERV